MTPYTGLDLESDLAAAVLKKWASNSGKLAGIPGGLRQEPLPQTPEQPYATLTIEESRRADEPSTDAQWIVYRDPVISIRGTNKEEVHRQTAIVAGLFFGANSEALPIDGLMRLEPGRATLKTPPEKYQQQQVHLGTVRMTAWIHWDRSGQG